VTFAAITLDLDDTLWPIQPVIDRAEAELHRWLQQHAPATAQMFDVPGMRRLRDEVALDFPEKHHDFTWLRHRAIEQALCAAGDDMALTDAAFAHFFHWRQQVVLYPDALPALQALSARWPLMALTNGNADLAVVGLADYFKAGILSARVFGLGKPHRAFFDARAAERGLAGWTSGPTVLYAPTWSDAIGSSSFLAAFSSMAARLPDGWRLVLKLHPHAEAQAPLVDRLVALAARPGIVVLRNEPLVFPWLERADAYVGDMSSLAYDFLAYDRPMVFLNRATGSAADASGSRLFACGAVLGPERYAEAYATIEAMRPNDRARYGALRAALDRDLHPPDVTAADVKAGLERSCAGPAPDWMRT